MHSCAQGGAANRPFLPPSMGGALTGTATCRMCGSNPRQACGRPWPLTHLPAIFLQKLLDAHEEQNIDSYTEAVSGCGGAALLRHPLTGTRPISRPGCELLSPVTPEFSQGAPEVQGGVLPALEVVALRRGEEAELGCRPVCVCPPLKATVRTQRALGREGDESWKGQNRPTEVFLPFLTLF